MPEHNIAHTVTSRSRSIDVGAKREVASRGNEEGKITEEKERERERCALACTSRGREKEKKEKKRNGNGGRERRFRGCVEGSSASTVGLFGTSLNVEGGRSMRRGGERTARRIEIVSRSLGRGSWPRRAWLAPSVSPRRPR